MKRYFQFSSIWRYLQCLKGAYVLHLALSVALSAQQNSLILFLDTPYFCCPNSKFVLYSSFRYSYSDFHSGGISAWRKSLKLGIG